MTSLPYPFIRYRAPIGFYSINSPQSYPRAIYRVFEIISVDGIKVADLLSGFIFNCITPGSGGRQAAQTMLDKQGMTGYI